VKAARNGAPAADAEAKSAKSVGNDAHGAAITEPHPRFRDGKPAVQRSTLLTGIAFKFVVRKPSPKPTVARFEWPAKVYNGIINGF
jgi:hypothetical protein